MERCSGRPVDAELRVGGRQVGGADAGAGLEAGEKVGRQVGARQAQPGRYERTGWCNSKEEEEGQGACAGERGKVE